MEEMWKKHMACRFKELKVVKDGETILSSRRKIFAML